MNREEFMEYVRENFNISCEARRLIDNILSFVENTYFDESEQYKVLCELLDGTIGLSDNEIMRICL